MSLYKRDGVWSYDFTLDGRRYRKSTRLRSKAAAREIEERDKQRAAMGASGRAPLTLGEAAARWFSAKVAGKKSEKTTAQRLEIMLRHFDPNVMIRDIDAPDVSDAIAARRLEPTRQSLQSKKPAPPTNSTVNRDLIDTTLRPIMRYAKRALKEPVHDIDWSEQRLAEPKERVRQFTPTEMQAWAEHLHPWHRSLRDFIGRYGLRLCEAFFPLDAIDTTTWEITVRGPRRKNGKPHTVPLLPEDAREIAARLSRARAAGLDTVWFKEDRAGRLIPIKPRGFQAASKAALVAAGIADARPAHDLRHHAGTAIMRASGNLKVVQALLGHENITSSARYAHADQSDVLRALRHAAATLTPKDDEKPCENDDLSATLSGT